MSYVVTSGTVEMIGRFSTGMEHLAPSPEKDQAGRYSTGMERLEPQDLWVRALQGRVREGSRWQIVIGLPYVIGLPKETPIRTNGTMVPGGASRR